MYVIRVTQILYDRRPKNSSKQSCTLANRLGGEVVTLALPLAPSINIDLCFTAPTVLSY